MNQIIQITNHDTQENFQIVGVENLVQWLNENDQIFSFSLGAEKPFYLQEFPDYDDTLPTLEGFHDSSYRNDICPSLFKWLDEKEERFIQVFCDYKDATVREWDDMERFTVFLDDHGIPAFASNDWADIEKFIKELKL